MIVTKLYYSIDYMRHNKENAQMGFRRWIVEPFCCCYFMWWLFSFPFHTLCLLFTSVNRYEGAKFSISILLIKCVNLVISRWNYTWQKASKATFSGYTTCNKYLKFDFIYTFVLLTKCGNVSNQLDSTQILFFFPIFFSRYVFLIRSQL